MGSVVVASVATPPDTVAVPNDEVPLKKVTVPVAADGVTVAVRVTLALSKVLLVDGETEVAVAVREAAHATARALASTEPRPVTRL
jgi:hypothetical protein